MKFIVFAENSLERRELPDVQLMRFLSCSGARDRFGRGSHPNKRLLVFSGTVLVCVESRPDAGRHLCLE